MKNIIKQLLGTWCHSIMVVQIMLLQLIDGLVHHKLNIQLELKGRIFLIKNYMVWNPISDWEVKLDFYKTELNWDHNKTEL